MAEPSTAIVFPDSVAAGSKVRLPEESSVSAWPPASVAPAPTVNRPVPVVSRRVTTETPPLETLSSAPSPDIAGVFVEVSAVWPIVIGKSFAAGYEPLASITLPESIRRPLAAFGSVLVEPLFVTRMTSAPLSGSLASLETTTLLAMASIVRPLAVCVRVPPMSRLPASSPSS